MLPKYDGVNPPKARGIYWGEVWLSEVYLTLKPPRPPKFTQLGAEYISLSVETNLGPVITPNPPIITESIFTQFTSSDQGVKILVPTGPPAIAGVAELV